MFKSLLALLLFPLVWACVTIAYVIVNGFSSKEEMDDE